MAAHGVFVVVLALYIQTSLVVAVAPDDAHSTCRTHFRYRGHHDWIPYANDTSSGTWRMLIDQYDYQNVLGELALPAGVWTARDVDGDGSQFSQGSGGTCTYQLRSPGAFTNPSTNNWVFTQAVDYIDAVELIVNVTVRFTGCTTRPDCTNDFVILHRFDTNNPSLSEAQRTDTSNYQYCFGDEQSSRIQQNPSGGETTIIRRFQRPVGSNYTHFGIQDIGTFGNVIRIFVYYEVCPRTEGRLIIYPEIPLPAQGSTSPITRTARCVEHAHNTTSLETRAHSDGRCEQQATCVCDLGFVRLGEDQCIGCDAGTYRSAQNSTCVNCPGNSTSSPNGTECSCTDDHYRAGHEGIGVKCTAPPPPVTNCVSNEVFDTGARVQWRGPSHCGGRTDCYYLIQVNDQTPFRVNGVNFNSNESHTVNNLEPDTTYSITISIHNGVSDQDAANAKLRQCSLVVTTIQGSVFMLGGIPYRSNTAAIIENIAENDFDSLKCTSALESCCQNPNRGHFYYPNGSEVLSMSQSGSVYTTHGSGFISLKQQQTGDPAPLGEYRCEIPDGRGMAQNLYITLGTASLELNARFSQASNTTEQINNIDAVREYVAWALAAVVTVLFLSSLTINIILLWICKKQQTSVKTPVYDMEGNPCYKAAEVNLSSTSDKNIQDIL